MGKVTGLIGLHPDRPANISAEIKAAASHNAFIPELRRSLVKYPANLIGFRNINFPPLILFTSTGKEGVYPFNHHSRVIP